MNVWITFVGILFVWWIVSQIIAWMITPGGTDDEVVESWFAIFLSPAVLLIVLVLRAEKLFYQIAERFGFTLRIGK